MKDARSRFNGLDSPSHSSAIGKEKALGLRGDCRQKPADIMPN